MNKTELILSRLYKKLGIKRDVEFCSKYDIKANTLTTWKKRNKVPYELIEEISQNENISLDWLLFGKKTLENNHSNTVIGDNNITTGGTINGNISINTSKFNHKDDVAEIIELLEYAPSGFLTIIKEKLLAFKKMSEF